MLDRLAGLLATVVLDAAVAIPAVCCAHALVGQPELIILLVAVLGFAMTALLLIAGAGLLSLGAPPGQLAPGAVTGSAITLGGTVTVVAVVDLVGPWGALAVLPFLADVPDLVHRHSRGGRPGADPAPLR